MPELWNTRTKFTVLFLGGLGERKGIHLYLEIARRFQSEVGGAAQFLIVGDGPERATVTQAVASSEYLQYCGVVTDDQKVQLYNSCHVLVSPSLEENYHCVSAESQLCGLPVISSDLSGPREIIKPGETGLLVPSGSVDAFVSALRPMWKKWTWARSDYIDNRKRIAERASGWCLEGRAERLAELFLRFEPNR
jgi:glycosyltransferase involved in cell wall biosynthesis